jgi:nitrous oxidase accessory protein
MKEGGRVLTTMAVAAIFLLFVADAAIINVSPGESIQAAVNAAGPGDTIEVQGGVYYESLNISKQIVLEGKGHPLLGPGSIGSGITLRANGVAVSGFDIRTTRRTGIYVLSSNNVIKNNTVSGCLDGIRLDHSVGNTVALNDVNNNTNGMTLFYSRQNIIKNNIIKDNNINEESDCGIFLTHSQENVLQDNNMLENGDCAISLRSSSSNFLLDNNVSRNDWYGISLSESSNHNIISGNNASSNKAAGIYLDRSQGNSLLENKATDNSRGIHLNYDSNNNFLEGNSVWSNENGLHLANHSSNNTIKDNTALNNGYGIYLTFSSGWNLIFSNHLVDNVYNAYDMGQNNLWDNGSIGNYYSDLGRIFYVPGGPSVDKHPMEEPER